MPDDVVGALRREARRRRIPLSQVVREAIELKLGRLSGERQVPFAALGRSGHRTTARDIDEILGTEWHLDRDR